MSLQETPNETLWYSSLLLLGYRETDPQVQLTKTMFDHPNPAGFQQVFHFLLSLLQPDKAKIEFRDCWPVLDKKLEAEFRRKVVLLVKEIAKDSVTGPLPSTNPALFMSPGGSRFKTFLSSLCNHVLRTLLGRSTSFVLGKPTADCKRKMKRACLHRFYHLQKENLVKGAECQQAIRTLEKKSKNAMADIDREYFALKKQLEVLEKESQEDELKSMHPEFALEGKIGEEKILEYYDEQSREVKDIRDKFVECTKKNSVYYSSILSVIDQTTPKLKLNLDNLPRETVESSSLTSTYSALLSRFLEISGKTLECSQTSHSMDQLTDTVTASVQQCSMLDKLRQELESSVSELRNSLIVKMELSAQVDWATCALAIPSKNTEKEQELLLPPSPSLISELHRAVDVQPSLTPKIQLSSPAPAPPTSPDPAQSTSHNLTVPSSRSTTNIQTTPTSSMGQLNRRFPRKITPDPSPLLRQSLIQSTVRRNSDCHQADTTKDSLGLFSPVLSSTMAQNNSSTNSSEELQLYRPSPTYREMSLLSEAEEELITRDPTNTADEKSPLNELKNETASKIDTYRQFLQSVKIVRHRAVSPPRSEVKANLLKTWNTRREMLSPGSTPARTSPAALFSEWETPKINIDFHDDSLELDDRVTTRLDLHMQDCGTLSDTSTLDLSLGGLSLGEDQLLSPHIK